MAKDKIQVTYHPDLGLFECQCSYENRGNLERVRLEMSDEVLQYARNSVDVLNYFSELLAEY